MPKLEWKTEKRKINDLVPYEHNPRQMTEKQNKDLTKSLEKFNLVEIPAINVDGTILAGHQRLRIMQTVGRGDEEIDVRVPNRQLTEKEVQEYNIRSNKNTGEFDFDILANAFETEDLLDWGFDPTELKIETPIDEDDAPAVGEGEANTKEGDIFLLGHHRLICGDSTKIEDVERLMNGQKADMVFTDPPYNVDYEGKTKDALKIDNDKFKSSGDFYQFLLDAFVAVANVTKSGGGDLCLPCRFRGFKFQEIISRRGVFTEAMYYLE